MNPAVEVERLSVRFPGLTVLDDVSFAIESGRAVGVLGPNGGGKTTLMRALLGMEPAARGSVRLLGKAPGDLEPGTIGYIPQLRRVDRAFPALAIEVVVSGLRGTWPARIRREERDAALAALERTGAAQVADRSVASLSGGEWQRVHLARCLARRPKLLMLDEPASGLDVAGEGDFFHLIEEYRNESGATLLMVTHDWEGVRAHADEVLLVHGGGVRCIDPGELEDEHALLELFGHVGHIRETHGDHAGD